MNKENNYVKHIWIFLSSYGIFFALLSWGQEILVQRFFWKGAAASVLGFFLYKFVINKI